MRAAALRVELLLPGPQSIKEKRAMLRPIIEGLRRLGSFSVAEVDRHDSWQRATIGVAVVATDGHSLGELLVRVDRYLDSRGEIEVIDVVKTHLEVER